MDAQERFKKRIKNYEPEAWMRYNGEKYSEIAKKLGVSSGRARQRVLGFSLYCRILARRDPSLVPHWAFGIIAKESGMVHDLIEEIGSARMHALKKVLKKVK